MPYCNTAVTLSRSWVCGLESSTLLALIGQTSVISSRITSTGAYRQRHRAENIVVECVHCRLSYSLYGWKDFSEICRRRCRHNHYKWPKQAPTVMFQEAVCNNRRIDRSTQHRGKRSKVMRSIKYMSVETHPPFADISVVLVPMTSASARPYRLCPPGCMRIQAAAAAATTGPLYAAGASMNPWCHDALSERYAVWNVESMLPWH